MERLSQRAIRYNAHKEHVPSDETDKAISFINSQNLGWKADVCKLQKHHAEYGSHCDNEDAPVSLAQTKSKKVFGENTEDFKAALEKAQHWAKTYQSADEIPDSEIPESYNFADIDGYDFLGPIRD
jgi:hypothetical protein